MSLTISSLLPRATRNKDAPVSQNGTIKQRRIIDIRNGASLGLDGSVSIGKTSAYGDPIRTLEVHMQNEYDGLILTGESLAGTNTGTGTGWFLGYNDPDNIQSWFGDPNYVGDQNAIFLRMGAYSGGVILDSIAGDAILRKVTTIGVANDTNSGVMINSKCSINGAVAYSGVTVTTSGIISSFVHFVTVSNALTAITLTMPSPASLPWREIKFSRSTNSTGVVRIASGGGLIQNLNGTMAATTVLAANNAAGAGLGIAFISNGTSWLRA